MELADLLNPIHTRGFTVLKYSQGNPQALITECTYPSLISAT